MQRVAARQKTGGMRMGVLSVKPSVVSPFNSDKEWTGPLLLYLSLTDAPCLSVSSRFSNPHSLSVGCSFGEGPLLPFYLYMYPSPPAGRWRHFHNQCEKWR